MNPIDLSTLEELFDHIPDVAFFVKDLAGRYRVVNESLVERCGLRKREELIGKHVRDLFPRELAKSYAEQDERVLKTGRPLLDRLELHWHAQRRTGWCLSTKLPIKNRKGVSVGIIGLSRDVQGPEHRNRIPQRLSEALEYLDAHFSDPVSPAELAMIAGLSPTRFARLIRSIYRLTPVQLIAKTRLGHATQLLRESDQSVVKIAHASGYYDHSAFARAFKSATGVTPTQYRSSNGPRLIG